VIGANAKVGAKLLAEFLHYDVETRSQADLKKVGTYRYASNPHTEAQCAALALDFEPIHRWVPGQPLPKRFAKHIENGGLMVAHGAQFERAIHRCILTPKHGWPEPKLEQFRCSQSMALALSLPPALENIAPALGVDAVKDAVGKRIMLQMTKPRKARKGEDPDEVHWYDDEERHEKLQGYCEQDVEVMRRCFVQMWPLTDDEEHIWRLDQIINDRGFYIDADLLLAMRRIITDAGADIDRQMIKLTGGAVQTVGQVAEIKKWLFDKHHVDIGSLSKTTIPLMLADPKVPQKAKDVLELRIAGAQAAVKKVDAFLARRDNDGRVRGSFMYHSAGTGRWASRGAQVHNLKRLTTDDQDKIVAAVNDLLTGDYKVLKVKYARPLQVVGDNIRTAICAAPGKVLIGADFSGIEARVTAWVAGELRKIKVFQDYDAGKGPDPYVATGADIMGISVEEMLRLKKDDPPLYKRNRQGGKGGELAFGFQGGVNAYVKFVPEGLFTLDEIQTFKVKWRKAHPNVVKLWYGLNDAAISIARKASSIQRGANIEVEPIPVNNLEFSYINDNGGFMFMELPSGRRISYPGINRTMRWKERFYITKPEDIDPADLMVKSLDTYFMDNSGGRWHRVFLYGGIICENAIQGIARDLLAAAMVRIEAAGFPIVAHVHDECVIEVPKKNAAKIMKEFVRLMCILPDWAVTPHCPLPVVANGWMAERYVK
jgi:DNA polymerase